MKKMLLMSLIFLCVLTNSALGKCDPFEEPSLKVGDIKTAGVGYLIIQNDKKIIKFLTCFNRSPCNDLDVTQYPKSIFHKNLSKVVLYSIYNTFEEAIKVYKNNYTQVKKDFRSDSGHNCTMGTIFLGGYYKNIQQYFHNKGEITFPDASMKDCGCEELFKNGIYFVPKYSRFGKFTSDNKQLYFNKEEYPKVDKVIIQDAKKCNLNFELFLGKSIMLHFYEDQKFSNNSYPYVNACESIISLRDK